MKTLRYQFLVAASLCLSTLFGVNLSNACPLCGSPGPPLSSKIANSDTVVLAQWISSSPKELDKAGSTQYKVVRVYKSIADVPSTDQRVVIPAEVASQSGNLFLLLGRQLRGESDVLDWQPAIEISETGYNYLLQAPSIESSATDRLAYYIRFLQYPDKTISDDAFAEFAQASFTDVAKMAGRFSRSELRDWIQHKETLPARTSFYGMLLGLCGNKSDAEYLESKIFLPADQPAPRSESRLGVEGLIAGYLWLTRDKGLNKIDKLMLKDEKTTQTDAYAVMQAIRFIWSYSNQRISKQRLRYSMRLLLRHPELAPMAVADLARWNDWSVGPQLEELYSDEMFATPIVRRKLKMAIISYFTVLSSSDEDATLKHRERSRQFLQTAEKNDPRIYRQAVRFIKE